jgi:glucokinase
MPERPLVLAIDVGATKTALAVLDSRSRLIVAKRTKPIERGQPAAELAAAAHALFADMLADRDASFDDVRGVGLALPGAVERGVLLRDGKLDASWARASLERVLSEGFGVPAFVEQDANAAALGEGWHGCAQSERDYVFLALGASVAAGIVSDGRILRGGHSAAGALGELVIAREGLGEGRRGDRTLDATIGGDALRERVARIAGALTTDEALVRARSETRFATFRDDTIDHLALALIALCAVVDPCLIVLGGGLADARDDLVEPLRHRLSGELARDVRVVCSTLGVDAPLFGVAFGAVEKSRPAKPRVATER